MRLREAEALVHHYQALHLGTQLLDEHSRVLGTCLTCHPPSLSGALLAAAHCEDHS